MENCNDPIRAFQAELDNKKVQAERLRPIIKVCEEAIQRCDFKATISVDMLQSRNPKVRLTTILNKLDDVTPLFRELAKEGLRTNKENPYKDHNAFDIMAMREYDLGNLTVMVVLITSKKEDDDGTPRCRLEQVGVKEVPVYEMKCD